jgi:hypothetical protein
MNADDPADQSDDEGDDPREEDEHYAKSFLGNPSVIAMRKGKRAMAKSEITFVAP